MKKLFLLVLPFAFFSCSSDDDATSVVVPPPSAEPYSYMRGTMDETPFDYTYIPNNVVPTSYGAFVNISQFGLERWFSYTGSFAPTITSDENIYISFENIYSGSDEDETLQFHTAFIDIPTNYLNSAEDVDQHLRGVSIGYKPEEGVFYNSKGGSQSGSTFVITHSSEGIEIGLKAKTIGGTFSCKLYKEGDVSDVMTINGGSFKVVLREDAL